MSEFFISTRRARTIGSLLLLVSAVVGVGVFRLRAQAPAAGADGGPSSALSQAARPFLERNCISCHNAGLPSGNLDMQLFLASNTSLLDDRDVWQTMVYRMQAGLMPPPELPRPPRAEMDATIALINRALIANPRPTTAAPVLPKGPFTKDWLTYSYDEERTAWARGETQITRQNASKLSLLWRLQTDTKPVPVNLYSTMTEPLVVNNVPTKDGPKKVLYVATGDDTIYAIDAVKGAVLWTRSYPNTATPAVPATGQCPNNLNATPVIDKSSGTMYFLPNDGKLRGVSIINGEDKFPATSIVTPFTRNFSLNLVDGVIYTGTTRGCQNAASSIVGIDVADPDHAIYRFNTSHGKGSGPWGRAGIVKTPFGVIAMTADGAYDPASGRWGDSVVELARNLSVVDSFTPANEQYINAKDLDVGSSSPIVFPFDDRTLVAGTAKEGVIYLMDAKDLGGKDHRTPLYTSPRWSNDGVKFGLNGMWSVMSSWVDAQGKRWLLAPYYGPQAKDTIGMFKKEHGPTVNGELMAFTVEGTGAKPTLVPQWVSADLDLPGVAVVMNGVVLIVSNGDRASNTFEATGGRGGGRGASGGTGGGGGRGRGNAAAAAAEGGGDAPPVLAGRGGRGGGGGGRGNAVEASIPGSERDAEWHASQSSGPNGLFGGQQGGQRYHGGRDTDHTILYALDAATGEELYSSGSAIDSWSHYGEITVSDGVIYLTTWDGRLFAFGVGK